MKKPILIVFLAMASLCSQAQRPKVKFGDVSMDELKMDHYPLDSTAHAVILYEKGHFDSSNFGFTKFVRLKIFDNAGTSWASFLVQTPAKSEIKGITYNLEDGELTSTKLEKDNIYKVMVKDDFYFFNVFLPNVKPGSVIDLQYSFFGLPYRWNFQELIPVVYSELDLDATPRLQFKQTYYGLASVTQQNAHVWSVDHMPALRLEPFMNDYTNYLTHFQFDVVRGYSGDWQGVSDRLLSFDDFGVVIRESPFLNDEADRLKSSSYSVRRKAELAYAYIQNNIKWNGENSAYVTADYRVDFLKNHSGNSAEVNLAFISLMQKAGVNAYPLVLSTRDNGFMNPLSASLHQINYVASVILYGDSTLVVDATMPHGTPGILPARCLNMASWIVDPDHGSWVDPLQGNLSIQKNFIRIYPDEDGEMVAEISNVHEQYDYLEWADKYYKAGSAEEYSHQLAKDNPMLDITDYKVDASRSGKLHSTEKISTRLAGTGYLQDLGQEMILNPFLGLEDLRENPFKSENRTIPIDFVYPRKRSIVWSVTFPTSYTITAMPSQANIKLEDTGGHFTLLCQADGNILNMKCDFSIDHSIYSEAKYPIVKQFFSEIARVLNQSVQAQKTAQ